VKDLCELDLVLCDVFRLNSNELVDDLALSDIPTWDSLTHLDLVATLEEIFAIELSMDEIIAMTDIKAVRSIVFARVK
jgi:acyl carrier protein